MSQVVMTCAYGMSLLRGLGIVTALLAAATLLGWWLRIRRYRRIFRIPARRDDSLVCREAPATFPVSIDANAFALPAGIARRGQTAFLALRMDATALGSIREPFIEVRRGRLVYRQYFERGVRGQRYLNLSPVFAAPDDAAAAGIDLRGGSVRWRREASLILFEPTRVNEAEILVVAPHPDDAEIAAFGLYAGRRSWVATITAGERGRSDGSAVLAPDATMPRWTALLRVWDSLTIPQLGGVAPERCLNLVYPDRKLQDMHQAGTGHVGIACEDELSRAALRGRNRAPEFREGGAGCTWDGLVEELRRLLEKTKPDIVLCPHPLIDAHPDHVFTTVALEEAVRGAGRELSFLLYVVHVRDAPVYPFGPGGGWVSLPPWTAGEWVADSMYSHPLSPDVQQTKYFAVECQHDERTYSNGGPKTVARVGASIKHELGALLGGTGLEPTTFLRRAPRPNEIFWVASAKTLSELVTRALARYRAV